MPEISALYTYPVKSCAGISHDVLQVTELGGHFDRRCMLVDADNRFISQRTYPLMAKIYASAQFDTLKVSYADSSVDINLHEFNQPVQVKVWSDSVDAKGLNHHVADEWFSSLLGSPVRMVFMPDSCFRAVDPEFSSGEERVSFADGFPFLLCSEASLIDLNTRLKKPVVMEHFRPNIVVSGFDPYEEDQWRRFKVGDIEFSVVKPCARCSMVTLDAEGVFHKEPLTTLSKYRKNSFGVCFGQNLIHKGAGMLQVGMQLQRLE